MRSDKKKGGSGRGSRLRERQAVRTREDIERAAMEECLRLGYRKLQIRDITRKAGCALGTFYLHFKDKQEVFRKLLRRYLAELRLQID